MNISLGQYYPAKSFLHRMDPRVKIVLALLYIVCSTFLCRNIWAFAALLVSAFLLPIFGRIPLRILFRSIRPVFFVMLFTAAVNVFLRTGEGDPLWSFWVFKIYVEGLYEAGFMVVRILALIIGTSVFLTYTTTPISLTDAMEDLLSPLKIFHVSVHDAAMMMTIALRFIPTLAEDTEKIMTAQKSRGAAFSDGGLIKRAKALIPILIPLVVSAFRRADDLAVAMECRCYHGGEGRTRYHVLHTRFVDVLFLLLFVAFGTGLVFLNIYGARYGWGYTM